MCALVRKLQGSDTKRKLQESDLPSFLEAVEAIAKKL